MSLVESAGRLFDLMRAGQSRFTPHLLPGLSDVELTGLTSFHRVKLADEVVQFYKHFNLPVDYQYGQDQPTFYNSFWLLGLQQALLEKHSLGELAAEFFDDYAGSDQWLPFLQEDGNYFVLDMAQAADGQCPVLLLFQGCDPEPRFVSLAAMFDTMHDWLAEGVLHIEAGRISATEQAKRSALGAVALKHNAGIEFWQQMI